MPSTYQEPSTTARDAHEGQVVDITHPFHPLYGRRYELLTVRQTWGEYRVFFYDEQGVLTALPASWTNAGEADPFVTMARGRAHYRPADLVQLATLVAQLGASVNTGEGT